MHPLDPHPRRRRDHRRDRRRHEPVRKHRSARLIGGTCPGSNKSAGRIKSTRTRPGNPYLKGAIGAAACRRLTIGAVYDEPGGDFYARLDPDRAKHRAVDNQLHKMGYAVTLEPLGTVV